MSTEPNFTEIKNNQESFGIYVPDGGFERFKKYINEKLAGKTITSYQDFLKHVGNIKTGVILTSNASVFKNRVDYDKIYRALYPNNVEESTEKPLEELSDDDKKKQMENDKQKENDNHVGGKRTRRNKKSKKARKTYRRRK